MKTDKPSSAPRASETTPSTPRASEAVVPFGGNGGASGAEAVSVDKIRDLLFGNQMQDYDRRFSKLEERFLQRFKDIELETARNLGAFESNAKKQVDSLAGQLREEKDQRADADKEIERMLRDQNQAMEKRIRSLSDQLSQLDRDMVRSTHPRVAIAARRPQAEERGPRANDREDVCRIEQREDRPIIARKPVRRGRQVPQPGHGFQGHGQERGRRSASRFIWQQNRNVR